MSPEGTDAELRVAAEAVLSRIDEIAAAMIARCVTEIPAYQRLPAAVLKGDLVANAIAVCKLFLTVVAEGRKPTDEELALPISWGAERARDGLPLEAVLTIYPMGAREAWEQARRIEGVRAELLVSGLFDFLAEVSPRMTAAYLREREALDWEQREYRRNIARGLLAGRPVQRDADRAGYELAERYHVAVFSLPAPSESTTTTELFRAVQSELDGQPDILATFEGPGGVLLVPAAEDDRVDTAVRRLADAAGGSCPAAVACADTIADIPAAHAQAVDVLALARRLGRGGGPHRLADLALEYQLSQPGPARRALAEKIRALAAHPHLLEALRAFLAAEHRRDEAAAALTVHRNTLTYRLGRIRRITGYDPIQPADARRLAAALTAFDIEEFD